MSDVLEIPHDHIAPVNMSVDQWREAFIAAMMRLRPARERNESLRKYASYTADSYYMDRALFCDAMDAAACDISNWRD